jgi:putative redox protein
VVSKPPTVVDLAWKSGLQFAVSSAGPNSAITIDGDSKAGPSPVQTLAFALAGCMAADIVHIVTKARHPLRGLRAHLVGHRAQEDPHRLVRVELRFTVEGAVPPDAIARAISLSHERYCSVWHSMRQDIDFNVTFDIAGHS